VEKDLFKAMCNAHVPGESGELYAVATAGSLITGYKAGTAHDAPFDDNRRVPILIKAPGVKPQEGEGTLLQVAPTLAALLGIDPPAAATAPTLFKIQKR
jgi:arylsulfatase A-like enzyme